MSENTEAEEQFREACCIGNTDLLKQLMKNGIDVNSQNKINGWTGLHWAAKRGHSYLISILLSSGANPDIKNWQGKSPADISTDSGIRAMLSNNLVLETGPDDRACTDACKNELNMLNITEEKPGEFKFVPNYLSNPVFPYIQENNEAPKKIGKPTDILKKIISETEVEKKRNLTTDVIPKTSCDEDELVLKVRNATSEELDFIEVELNYSELKFDNLVEICCTELNIGRDDILKIRKLPDTIIRKDKDVRRLKPFQELEIILRQVRT